METWGVICDYSPAQVVGLLQFLRNTAGVNSTIMRMSYLNDFVNLVLAQAIKSHFFSEVFAMLPEIIRTLHSAQSIHLLSLRYPKFD
jgi:hypothetical protein